MDLGASEWTTFRRVMLPLAVAGHRLGVPVVVPDLVRRVHRRLLSGRHGTRRCRSTSGASFAFRSPCPASWRSGSIILAVSIAIATAAELIRRRGVSGAIALPVGVAGAQAQVLVTPSRRGSSNAQIDDEGSASVRPSAASHWSHPPSARPRLAADKLTYFTWSGYELPDFNKSFLAAHPDGVEASIFSDDDDAFTKVKAGFRPDIAHPCYDKIARWNKEGLLQPIDTKRLKNWDKIFPVFKNLPDIQAGDGKVWMVPWDWGNTSITYRTDLIKNPEMSWNLLWDKQYSGRMSTIDAVHDTPVVAALRGRRQPVRHERGGHGEGWGQAARAAAAPARLYHRLTSVQQSLASGELVAAMTWNDSGDGAEEAGRAGRVHEAEGGHAHLDLRLRAAEGRQERRPCL